MSTFDLAPMIDDLGPTTITRRRYPASATNSFGETVPGTPADSSRRVAVHPSGRKTLERLAVSSAQGLISIYDTEAHQLAGTTAADEWLYEGRWYEVIDVADYGRLGNIHLAHAALKVVTQ